MLFRALSAILLLSAPALGSTAEIGPTEPSGARLGLFLGLERFNWTEQDPNQSRELLEESGPRLSGGITYDNFLLAGEGAVYALEARVYQGEVNYDGESQKGVAVSSEVSYSGGLGELRGGYRFVPDWTRYGFDVMAGLGAEYWSRDIKDSFDANGNPIRGYKETYRVAYTKVGLGFADLSFKEWYGRLEIGARYPLEVKERIDEFDADLSPDPQTSLYGTYELSKATRTGQQIGITLYYDSYSFDESPLAESDIGLVKQPESDMEVIGLRFAFFL